MCKKQKLFLLVYAKYNVFLSFDFWGEIHTGIRRLQKTDFISFYKVNIIKDQNQTGLYIFYKVNLIKVFIWKIILWIEHLILYSFVDRI